jgi:flagellar hook protein FlgE
MLRSMFSGLSGLRNHQIALDVVGNNVANVNTVGFKASRIQFAELLSQTIQGASSPQADGRGGTNPIQVGLGIGTAAIEVSHQQGNLQATGKMSDMAIQGNGFFILSDDSSSYYSRAGAFSFDANGTLTHSNGMKVQGWLADATGTIDKNSNLGDIVIPIGQTINANATSEIEYAHNLDARSYQLGTPLLQAGNSANIARVTGKFTGDVLASNLQANAGDASFPVGAGDLIGTHIVNVAAETHSGLNGTLNGTEKLVDMGVTAGDLTNFRVYVDGVGSSITLAQGTGSSVSDLISAINSQVIGVTAELSGGDVKISRDKAGLNASVYVEDTDQSETGMAALVFGGNNYGGWASHATTTGTVDTLRSTDTIAAAILTATTLTVTTGAGAVVYDPQRGVTTLANDGSDTVQDLVDDFNTWASVENAYSFFMGLDGQGPAAGQGQLFVGHTSDDVDGDIVIDDTGVNGIADNLFSLAGNWAGDSVTAADISVEASILHSFQESDGSGTHYSALSFTGGDTNIAGLTGLTLLADTDGFKTGTMVVQTVEETEHITTTAVYDSLGNEHVVTLTLERTTDNNWNWVASGIGVSGAGTLTFDSAGKLQSGATSGVISVAASGGASSLTITPDFSDITQFADTSTMVYIDQDGYANGALSTFSVDAQGEILGIYTNGLNQSLGQMSLAAFNNPGGLVKYAESMFVTSNNSGEAQVGEANSGGRGALSAGTLEMSNVDIAQEFANMIIYQRGFQANSKMVTTGDEILQTLVGMKR